MINHIGIIPDGSRRWAKKNKISTVKGYFISMEKLTEVIDFSFSNNVKSVSTYLSSLKNIQNRSEENINEFLSSQVYLSSQLLPTLLEKYKFKVNVVGNLCHIKNEDFVRAITDLVENTKMNTDFSINLLIAYDPVEEIYHSFNTNPNSIKDRFWVKEDLDLIIRTSVIGRLSDFLPLQSSFAELFFYRKYFPDITIKDMENVFAKFLYRKRRFGG
jgi:undecaprenyl diphosphate synthase